MLVRSSGGVISPTSEKFKLLGSSRTPFVLGLCTAGEWRFPPFAIGFSRELPNQLGGLELALRRTKREGKIILYVALAYCESHTYKTRAIR
jgi:hypothetical protein